MSLFRSGRATLIAVCALMFLFVMSANAKAQPENSGESASEGTSAGEAPLAEPESPTTKVREGSQLLRKQSRLLAFKTKGDGKAQAKAVGASYWYPIQSLNGWHVIECATPAAALTTRDALADLDGVEDVHLQYEGGIERASNDPLYDQQWHLENTSSNAGAAGNDINVAPAWNTATGDGVVLALVDDAVETSHPDLSVNASKTNLHFDFLDNDNDVTPLPTSDESHGTCTAGIAGAQKDNNVGVAGVAPDCSLVGIRMLGTGVTDAIMASSFGHQNNSIDVYSCSWTIANFVSIGPLGLNAVQEAYTNGRNGLGCIVTCAAGNSNLIGEDANANIFTAMRGVIVVGGVHENGQINDYSEGGESMFCSAMTSLGNITTTDRVGTEGFNDGTVAGELSDLDYTQLFEGTSAVAPEVAGVCALMLEVNPTLTWRDVQHILVETCRPIDLGHADWTTNSAGVQFNRFYGFGVVDAEAAVQEALTWANVDVGAPTVFETDAAVAAPIPDNSPVGVTRTLTINDDINIEHVRVDLRSNHTNWTELLITLTSPGGTTSVLHQDTDQILGQPGANGFPVADSWRFRSNRFWGESSQGDWTLRVVDTLALDIGNLTDWTLAIDGTDPVTTPPPTVTGVNPNPAEWGMQISIAGSDFVGASVTIGGVPHSANLVGGNLTTTILNTVPVGVQTIQVTTAFGSDTTDITIEVPASQLPDITSVSPSSIQIGKVLSIGGDNLSGGTLTIGGVTHPMTLVGNSFTTTIKKETPLGVQDLVITTPAGTDTSSVRILADPTPLITDILPQPGQIGGALTISGFNFQGSLQVTIGGQAQVTDSATSTEVVITLPVGVPLGRQLLTLTTSEGADSEFIDIEVPAHLIPTMTPLADPELYYGMEIDITGTNLDDAIVTIGGIQQVVNFATSTAVEFVISSGTPLGNQTMRVTSPTGFVESEVQVGALRVTDLKPGDRASSGCSISQSNGVGYAVLLLGMLIALSRRRRRLLE